MFVACAQVASILTLTAAAIALNEALHEDSTTEDSHATDTTDGGEDADTERPDSTKPPVEVAAGSLIAATAATILSQMVLALVTKLGPYIYGLADIIHLCIQVTVSYITYTLRSCFAPTIRRIS